MIVAVITARSGSKGIPGKNLKLMAGKPMIAWTIEAALYAHGLDRVLVSTDDPEIARVSHDCGAEVPFLRPPHLATDAASHLAVLDHVMDWLAATGGLPEYLLLLQPTSPLRLPQDIEGGIRLALDRKADAVIGVSETHPPAAHPWLAKRLASDGVLEPFMSGPTDDLRRQSMPQAFALNGALYLNRCESLRRERTMFPVGALAYTMPVERSIDVDTPLDFFLAEQLLKQRYAIP
jgi:CMP-N,N'-diacetyllegionaminic acid synthase